MMNCRSNADLPFCLNARLPSTPAVSRPCPLGAGYARSLDTAYVPGWLSPGRRAISARSACRWVKHKPRPKPSLNALILCETFWSSKMMDCRHETSPKMTKNEPFPIVEGDRTHDGRAIPNWRCQFRRAPVILHLMVRWRGFAAVPKRLLGRSLAGVCRDIRRSNANSSRED